MRDKNYYARKMGKGKEQFLAKAQALTANTWNVVELYVTSKVT